MAGDYRVEPGTRVRLADADPGDCGPYKGESETVAELYRLRTRLFDLQSLLYADSRYALLIIIQAMDTGGKDGVIRSVFSGVDPCGCQVTSFKVPSTAERGHDYLWRVHTAVPSCGNIGIFNRSHYEDVLVVRVHAAIDRKTCRQRFEQINAFERQLAENRVVIRKFFLHISKREQEERLVARLKNPRKNWKFSLADLQERKYWDEYMEAYEDALSACSTAHAPWYIVPANHKWYRNLVVTRTLVDTLEQLDLKWPEASPDVKALAAQIEKGSRLPESLRNGERV